MSIYLVGFIILAGFGCLPTVSQALLAGYAFGVPVGLLLALLGFGGASLVAADFGAIIEAATARAATLVG